MLTQLGSKRAGQDALADADEDGAADEIAKVDDCYADGDVFAR